MTASVTGANDSWVSGQADGSAPQLLLIEDDENDAERILRWIRLLPFDDWEVLHARTLHEALDLLEDHDPEVAVVDLTLPDATHLDTVQTVVAASPDCAVIVQTGEDGCDAPTRALELGAQDYLDKNSLTLEIFDRAIRYAVARKHTESALHHTRSELAQSDADLDDFAHVVAHDLRAPVRTARLLADRMLAQVEAPDELTADLGNRLDDALAQVDSMIISMLDYSALRGALPDPEPTRFADVVSAAADAVQADVEAAHGRIEMDIPDDLVVLGREDLLTRVLVNLFANSVKYRRENVAPHIAIRCRRHGSFVRIVVQDNGVGIPPEARERVFQILERLQSGTSGLGFGLAICRRILTGLGGSISIDPDDDDRTGTRVLIDLRSAPALDQR